MLLLFSLIVMILLENLKDWPISHKSPFIDMG